MTKTEARDRVRAIYEIEPHLAIIDQDDERPRAEPYLIELHFPPGLREERYSSNDYLRGQGENWEAAIEDLFSATRCAYTETGAKAEELKDQAQRAANKTDYLRTRLERLRIDGDL